jgi:hypothetical protein
MPKLDPLSTIRPAAPVSKTPSLEPLYDKPAFAPNSIESTPVDRHPQAVWTSERPALTPPDSLPVLSDSVYRFISTTEESRELGEQILETFELRLKDIKLKIREISADNIQKLQEAARRAADSSFWSVLKKIATCLFSAFSMIFGISSVATGGSALIGGAMIASGILSLSNFAIAEAGAWDWISKQLSNDNEERQKMFAWLLPSAVGVIAGGIGLVGSVQGVVSGAFQFAEKAAYVAQTALTIFDAATTFGRGHADAHLIWTQSDLSKIQADLTIQRTNFDSVMREIECSMNDFRAIKAKTKKIIQILSQSNVQLVRQV